MHGYGGITAYYARHPKPTNPCPACQGTGVDQLYRQDYMIDMECDWCGGTGTTPDPFPVTLVIVGAAIAVVIIAACAILFTGGK